MDADARHRAEARQRGGMFVNQAVTPAFTVHASDNSRTTAPA